MTTTGQTDLPKVGDLVYRQNLHTKELGIIRRIDYEYANGNYPYHIEWLSGSIRGYKSSHPIKDVIAWRKKLTEKT